MGVVLKRRLPDDLPFPGAVRAAEASPESDLAEAPAAETDAPVVESSDDKAE